MDVNTLKRYLLLTWDAKTAKGDWTPDCPSLNQCAITSLVVQDFFGGDLLRCLMTNGDSHYWNRLPNGSEVDFTEDQFDYITDQPIKRDFVIRAREYVLSFPETVVRYNLLKNRIEQLIAKNKQ